MKINDKLVYLCTSAIRSVRYDLYTRKLYLDLIWWKYGEPRAHSSHTVELIDLTFLLLHDSYIPNKPGIHYKHSIDLDISSHFSNRENKIIINRIDNNSAHHSHANLYLEIGFCDFYFHAKYISIDGELSDLQQDKVIKPRTEAYYISFWEEAEAWHKSHIMNQPSP